MANNINVKIAVDKEAEFKRSLQQIGGELKSLGAEAKKLQAIYAEDANTYTALSAKLKNLREQHEKLTEKLKEQKSALENQQNLQKAYEAQTEGLKRAAAEAADAYNNAAKKTEELEKVMKKADSAFRDNERSIDACKSRIQTYERQITNTETEQIKLEREIDKTSGYLREAATAADGTARSIDQYGKEVKDAAEDTKSFANAADLLAQAIVASGAIEGAEKLKDAIVATAKASIEYESAFAGVRKTVDGTAEELAEISDGIKQMALEIPMASKELASIAESAGQLGIATGDVLGFTETMAALSVTTNLSAEEAATSLAKFANITKMSADEYSNLGSSIVALGNDFATTEADIVAMATRLASTGEVVGLTEPQILAVATALSSVGIEAEAGGTAFSKLLKNIATEVETGSKKVEGFALVAGMSAKEFSKAWKEDAVGAVSKFIEGLGRLDAQGGSAISVLSALGLEEVRLSNAVLSLASADGILTEALELSNTAWAENTALADEAAIRYETTESKLQLLNNSFENLKITVGDELVNTFGGAIDGLTDLTKAADEYVKKNPDVVAGITAVAAGLGSLAVAGTVIPLITTLWGLLSANPVGLATAGLIALAAAATTYYIASSDAVDAVSVFNRKLAETAEQINTTRSSILSLKTAHEEETAAIQTEQSEIEEAIRKIEELGSKTDLTASESEILKGSIDKLNSSIPGLKLGYDNLNDSLEDTVYHLRLVASAQALVDEAVAKSDLRDSLNSNFDQLDADIKTAKKDLDDANALLADYIKLRDEYVAPDATKSGRARGIGSNYNPYENDVKQLEKAVEDANALYISAIGAREANKRKILEIDAEITKLDSAYAEKAEEIKNSTLDLFESTEQGTDTVTAAVTKAAEEVKKSASSTKEAVDSAGQVIIDHAKTVQSNLDALTKEYDSVYQSAKSSLGGIGGLFGEVAFNTDKSISDMISGMQTQADYFTGYMLNLQRAAQIGIDEGLVAALADGSDESAGYLQKIINEFNQLSDKYGENSTEAQDFITDFNEAFEASSAAKDALARTMAGIATDFETRKGEILGQAQELISELEGYSGNAYDEVAAAVTATVGNVSDTLSRMETAISESSVRAGAAMQTLRETLDAKLEGTEEKGEEAGANYTAGLAKGIQEGMPVVTMAVQKLVDESIIGAVNQGLEIRSPSRVGMEQGEFYDEGIAVGIERNSGTVTNAALSMIDKLESSSRSAASAAGANLGKIMAQSMADALAAGRALSQAVASGTLTVDGKVVQSAASVGIPSLTGQAAQDWNEEQKRDFGLPSDWTNQDIVDWLNGGGAMSGGMSSTTKANIESAIKNESSGSHLVTVNRTNGYGKVTKYEPDLSKRGATQSSVVINQTFTGTTSYYDAKQGAKAGVQEATYY